MTTYYVYVYSDPRTELPFYIGKGCGDRMLHHLKETKESTENYLKWCKIKSITNAGMEPKIDIVFETYEERLAYQFEADLISKYGRIGFDENGSLTNRCVDNRPPTYAGSMPRNETYRKNISTAKLGDKNPMYGKEPWNKGKTGYTTSKRGQKRKWITDGISSKQVLVDEEIPSGWWNGRTGGAKGSKSRSTS